MKKIIQSFLIIADVSLIIGPPAAYEQGRIGIATATILSLTGIAIAAGAIFYINKK